MRRVLALSLALLLLSGVAYVRGCVGPRPTVLAVALEPSPAGLVPLATVRNDGGAGQVEVRFRIRDRATGRVVAEDAAADLERGEVLEVRGPSPLPPREYEIAAEADYPPR
jgi:hypothetical protein